MSEGFGSQNVARAAGSEQVDVLRADSHEGWVAIVRQALCDVYGAELAAEVASAMGMTWVVMRVRELCEAPGVDAVEVVSELGHPSVWFAAEVTYPPKRLPGRVAATGAKGKPVEVPERTTPAMVLTWKLEPIVARLAQAAGGDAAGRLGEEDDRIGD